MGKGKKKKGGKKSEIDTNANTSTKWDGQNQLSIGTRIEWTGSTHNLSSNIRIGTIVEHNTKLDNGATAPYRIRLDCGTLFTPSDIETKKHIRLSSVKPMTVTFNVRTRVMVKYGEEWFLAYITGCNKDWFERDLPPYGVLLDSSDVQEYKLFWGPAENIRDCYLSKIPKDPRDMPKLRFKRGDRVEACVGGGVYFPGQIMKVWYTVGKGDGDGSEAGLVVPYQICLEDEGRFIYAHNDNDHSVRRAKVQVGSPLSIAIGGRVECVWMEETQRVGTVTGHWIQQSDGLIVPYRVRLDNGKYICCRDQEESILPSKAPPPELNYGVNDRVDCFLGIDNGMDVWISGTVTACRHDWYKNDKKPYTIKFDDGRVLPFWPWNPDRCMIRASFVDASGDMELRFDVGDRVDCCTNQGNGMEWLPGTVVRTNYTDCSFEDGQIAPYKIQLDRGNHIYAPFDQASCIKESTVTPPTCWICFDNEQTKDNLIVRECACRGEEGNGFVHIKCLVQNALTKVDRMDKMSLSSQVDAAYIPFSQCITCKASFDSDSISFAALSDECYNMYGSKLKSIWNQLAITKKVTLLNQSKDYAGAQKILETELKRNQKLMATCIQLQKNIPDAGLLIAMSVQRRFVYLMELIVVHEKTKSLAEMKSALDDAFKLAEDELFNAPSDRIPLLILQARHSYLCGDKDEALKHAEKAVCLSRSDKVSEVELQASLLKCGNYNLHNSNLEVGAEQISEAVQILTRIY